MATGSRGLGYLDRYSVHLQIRIYPSVRDYVAELHLLDFPPQRMRISLTQKDLEDLNRSIQARIQDAADVFESTTPQDPLREHAIAQLARKGSAAYAQIFGEHAFPLRTLINDYLPEGTTIQISSEEFFIPWEFLCASDFRTSSTGGVEFWGLRHVVSRALIQDLRPGGLRKPAIECDIPRVGIAADVELEHVIAREIPYFEQLHSIDSIVLTKLPHLFPELREAGLTQFGEFISGDLHVLHFACHANPTSGYEPPSLQVSEQFPISMDDCFSYSYHLHKNPFVILNACRSGTANPLRSSNWASLLWRMGARGVVATEFDVPDSFAADFVQVLYTHLLDGISIGDALLLTRRSFWTDKQNPLGLAYSLYSSPSIKLERANHGRAND